MALVLAVGNYYQSPHVSWLWQPYPYEALAANTWQEVTHMQDPFGDEHYGCWFVYSPGAGIWFDIGVTISFKEHQDGYDHFSITTGDENEGMSQAAAAAGYDSIQFTAHVDPVNYPCDTGHTRNDGLKYMGLEIVGTKLVGTYPCGSPTGNIDTIKAGWQGSKPCSCDNSATFLACQGFPQNVSVDIGQTMQAMLSWLLGK